MAIMNDIAINPRPNNVLHINVTVRSPPNLIALDQGTSEVAMNLDTIVYVAISYPVIQELSTICIPSIIRVHERVVIAVIAVSYIVDV